MKKPVNKTHLLYAGAAVLLALMVIGRLVFVAHPSVTPARVSVEPPPMKETLSGKKVPVTIMPPPVLTSPQQGAATLPARPKIVIIIDDMGVDRARSREITALPWLLTLSYMSYPPHVAEDVAQGRAAGDEIMMHIPMEPDDKKLEAGAEDWFLNTGESPAQFAATLDRNLGAFSGYVGINNHMGSRLTADRRAMDQLMTELHKRDLIFVDSRTIASTVAAQAAADQGVPQVSRDVFLDDISSLAGVNRQLAELERIARKKGEAVAIGHPKDATIAALRAWLPTLRKKGFVLVPVKDVVAMERSSQPTDLPPGSAYEK